MRLINKHLMWIAFIVASGMCALRICPELYAAVLAACSLIVLVVTWMAGVRWIEYTRAARFISLNTTADFLQTSFVGNVAVGARRIAAPFKFAARSAGFANIRGRQRVLAYALYKTIQQHTLAEYLKVVKGFSFTRDTGTLLSNYFWPRTF